MLEPLFALRAKQLILWEQAVWKPDTSKKPNFLLLCIQIVYQLKNQKTLTILNTGDLSMKTISNPDIHSYFI